MKTTTYRCPQCGCSRFQLAVTQFVGVEFDDSDGHYIYEQPFGDLEWGDETPAICERFTCDWSGTLGDAVKELLS